MASSSPNIQQVPCSPSFVETVKYNSPVASVPDSDFSPLLGPAGIDFTVSYLSEGVLFCRPSWRKM